MEPLSFLVVLIFGFGGGYVYKTEKCKMEIKTAQKIEQKKEQ